MRERRCGRRPKHDVYDSFPPVFPTGFGEVFNEHTNSVKQSFPTWYER